MPMRYMSPNSVFKNLMKSVAAVVMLFAVSGHSEMTKVNVTKVADNLYKTSFSEYVSTQYCHENVTMQNAVIVKGDDMHYIVFQSGATCTVTKLFKEKK